MKRGFILLFITLAYLVLAQTNDSSTDNITTPEPLDNLTTLKILDNITTPEPLDDTTTTDLCGNGLEDYGENCETCPQDASCPEGYKCLAGSCTYTGKSNNLFLIMIVSLSFIIFAFVTLIIYRKYKEKQIFPKEEKTIEKKDEKKMDKPKTGFFEKQTPKDFPGIIKKQDIPKEKPAIKKKEGKSQLAILKNYIDESLKRGKNLNFIKDKLLKVGWTEDQINKVIIKNEGTSKLQGNKKNS